MDRKEIKEQEIRFLAKEFKKDPQLFTRETQIDDSQFLEKIGISLPNKIQENLFPGYLKLWPQDFIVEEILKDNTIQTVNFNNFSKEKGDLLNQGTLYTTLVKCGLSTIEVIEEIASFLNTDKKKIQFAGIKDKDALTAQLISFRGVESKKIEEISSPYFFFKDVYYGKGVVEIGGLKGNKFTILVRTNDSFSKEKFLANLEFIKKEGFFNFFYSQRFGSPRFINWFWGLSILRGEYKNAVLSFLCSEGQRETLYFKKIRKEIKNHFGNWGVIGKILENFPIIFQNEIKIVHYLKSNPSDFIGALNQIPEQVQLWVYAYGSLLFNRKISEYLGENKPMPEKTPLILSRDKNDWLEYSDFLKEDKIFNLPIESLKPFNYIQWKKREIITKEKAEIHSFKIIPEGVILSFTLPKGCYATTFLSHLFQLFSGMPPKNISDKQIDTKEVLGEESIKNTSYKFKDIMHSKTENLFEKFE